MAEGARWGPPIHTRFYTKSHAIIYSPICNNYPNGIAKYTGFNCDIQLWE